MTTKTEEREVTYCDTCEEEATGWHAVKCAECGKDLCTECAVKLVHRRCEFAYLCPGCLPDKVAQAFNEYDETKGF